MRKNQTSLSDKTVAGADELPGLAPPVKVLRQFRIVFNAVKTHFRNVEKVAGIGGAQLWALSVIEQRPGISVGELARALDVHQSTASNLLKALVQQELVAQGRTGADKRAVTITLLAAGEARLRKAPMPFAGVLPDALASMDAATLGRLEQDLNTLILALEAGNAGARIPLSDL